jgi:hypothetical protein
LSRGLFQGRETLTTQVFRLKAMKLSAAAYSAFVATSATKAGRYGGIRRVGE